MIRPPTLPDDERALLRTMDQQAIAGPDIAPTILFRLALYDLVYETEKGWRLTANGRDLLNGIAPAVRAAAPRRGARRKAVAPEGRIAPT